MIKRLLVPIDNSPAAVSALSIATSLARITRSELWALHVVDGSRFSRFSLPMAIAENLVGGEISKEPLPPEELLKVVEQTEKESQVLRQRFQEQCLEANVPGEFWLEQGVPSVHIVDYSKSVDLVVVGARGRNAGQRSHEAGVTVHELVAHTSRPVLVVPEEPAGEPIIVVAYDGSLASERVLRAVAEMAAITDMFEVHLITVSDDIAESERIQRRAIDYLDAYEVQVTPRIASGAPQEVIIKYCREVDASIVALGATSSNRLMEKIFGSTSSYLLSEVDDIAVLLMS